MADGKQVLAFGWSRSAAGDAALEHVRRKYPAALGSLRLIRREARPLRRRGSTATLAADERMGLADGSGRRGGGSGADAVMVFGAAAAEDLVMGWNPAARAYERIQPAKSHGKRVSADIALRGVDHDLGGCSCRVSLSPMAGYQKNWGRNCLDLIAHDVAAALTGRNAWGQALRRLDAPAEPPPIEAVLERGGRRGAVLAVDLETDGVGPDARITAVAAADGRGAVGVSDWTAAAAKTLAAGVKAWERAGGMTASWNGLAFDLPLLDAAGVPLDRLKHLDGMLLWRVACPQSSENGLGAVAPVFVDEPYWKTDSQMYAASGDLFTAADGGGALQAGAAKDALATAAAVAGMLRKDAADKRLPAVQVRELHATARAVRDMERLGVRADAAELAAVRDEAAAARDAVDGLPFTLDEGLIDLEGGVNPNSDKQVKAWAAGRGIDLPNVQRETLLSTGAPELLAVAEWGRFDRIRQQADSMLRAMRGGRLHTAFRVSEAVTGRLSSKNPALQNRMPEVRRGVVADPGSVLISADFSNIELRAASYLSGDATLEKLLADGTDLHAYGARRVFPIPPEVSDAEIKKHASYSKYRSACKTVHYALLYGSSESGVVKAGGGAAGQYYREFPALFPTLWAWMQETAKDAEAAGWVENAFGRRRYWVNPRDSRTEALNFPVQSNCAAIMHVALERAARRLPAGALRLIVHDELVAQVPEADGERWKSELAAVMERPMPADSGPLSGWSCPAEGGGPETRWSRLK